MKEFQFYKIGLASLLIFLSFPMPVIGNPFHASLPESKREEIKIIDEHTVEVGIGTDNLSVSCNILDAVQSIPLVGTGGEPDDVWVNKEKVTHFRKGLYTWDREGKYRVRLTTKYIREFGNIRIHVPVKGTVLPREQQRANTEPFSSYHQNLPQNIKEEITIIDNNMVEVAIGPDDHSVSATILHAVKSIPSVKDSEEPDEVFVNGEPVYHIRKGVYAWDLEGKNPIRLTTKYIRKFGSIQIHIVGDEPPSSSKEQPEPTVQQEPTAMSEPKALPSSKFPEEYTPELQVKTVPLEKLEKAPESLATPPVRKEESFFPQSHSPKQVPEKIKAGIVKGFRLARFGMNEKKLIKAIQTDFGKLESEIEKRIDPESGQRILTISSPTLDPENGEARINYYLSSLGQTLSRVDVIWGHPDLTKVSHEVLQKSAEKFKNLFHQLTIQPATSSSDKGPYIFYGEDPLGRGIKLIWKKPYSKDFKPLSELESTLMLSYFQPLQ